MCLVCIEYLKGNLTKAEAKNAYEEIILTSDNPNAIEHPKEAIEKWNSEPDESELPHTD